MKLLNSLTFKQYYYKKRKIFSVTLMPNFLQNSCKKISIFQHITLLNLDMVIIMLRGNYYLKKKFLTQMYFVTCPNPIVRLNVNY